MDSIILDENLVIEALSSSKTVLDASEKIYGKKLKKYSKRITDFCKKNDIDYMSLLKPKDEKHYYCKYCGKEILDADRSRKQYCNHVCSALATNKGRKHSEETKIKISHSLQKHNKNFNGIYKPIQNKSFTNKATNIKNKTSKYVVYNCINCGKECSGQTRGMVYKYCSSKCQHEYLRREFIEKWKKGEVDGTTCNGFSVSIHIRHYLLEKNNYKCEKCGFSGVNPYTNNTVLQIHHIDGDSSNNKEENLQVLCPNCHAMTDNFGSRNKNATKGRTQYFGKDKH